MTWVWDVLFIDLCAFLYRWGGGGYKMLPGALGRGWKPARRYGIPLAVALYAWDWWMIPPALLLCGILHFNLDEIEERDWDDVASYGFAQAFCFYKAGILASIVGAWWMLGVYMSNHDLPFLKQRVPSTERGYQGVRLDWWWVEYLQGAVIGVATVCIRRGWSW
jgi:hypothetical protein